MGKGKEMDVCMNMDLCVCVGMCMSVIAGASVGVDAGVNVDAGTDGTRTCTCWGHVGMGCLAASCRRRPRSTRGGCERRGGDA